jgi:hypothetical protein
MATIIHYHDPDNDMNYVEATVTFGEALLKGDRVEIDDSLHEVVSRRYETYLSGTIIMVGDMHLHTNCLQRKNVTTRSI